ncbi:MAG TPA: maleylpyruvate isomerase family mycothiol-dependent enzyme [Microthrixaceae bacterium]|nr:maleylpyruvate isomerase family mycothiol-dependent enzyme [Microthrixaceae bacterium]
MDDVLRALDEQHGELAGLIAGLEEVRWRSPTPCEGWDVADVVLHLAQSDELGVATIRASVEGSSLAEGDTGPFGSGMSIDDAVAASVDAERHLAGAQIGERWTTASSGLRAALAAADSHLRVRWAVGELSVRTLAATRLSEAWIHSGDVASGLGVELVPRDRLRHIARLAWRTLPYAFAQEGLELHGPVAFDLVGPDGQRWAFGVDDEPVTTVTGSGLELCLVAGRRRRPADTDLVAEGTDATAVLDLVRTYAL